VRAPSIASNNPDVVRSADDKAMVASGIDDEYLRGPRGTAYGPLDQQLLILGQDRNGQGLLHILAPSADSTATVTYSYAPDGGSGIGYPCKIRTVSLSRIGDMRYAARTRGS